MHIDLTSLLIGAGGGKLIEAAAVRALAPLPAKLVGALKDRYRAQIAAGKIDAPTQRLLSTLGRATFEWADQELPDAPGPEKMAAVVARVCQLPIVGRFASLAPDLVRDLLQAEYAAMKAEIKAEAGEVPPAPEKPQIQMVKEGGGAAGAPSGQ